MHFSGLAAIVLTVLAGCAAPQQGDVLASTVEYREVCLADSRKMPPGFLLQVRQALRDKGFRVRTISLCEDCTLGSCEATVMGSARYSSSPIRRLVAAELRLERLGGSVPAVRWTAPDAGRASLMDRMDDDAVEVRKLVDRLFPDPEWK